MEFNFYRVLTIAGIIGACFVTFFQRYRITTSTIAREMLAGLCCLLIAIVGEFFLGRNQDGAILRLLGLYIHGEPIYGTWVYLAGFSYILIAKASFGLLFGSRFIQGLLSETLLNADVSLKQIVPVEYERLFYNSSLGSIQLQKTLQYIAFIGLPVTLLVLLAVYLNDVWGSADTPLLFMVVGFCGLPLLVVMVSMAYVRKYGAFFVAINSKGLYVAKFVSTIYLEWANISDVSLSKDPFGNETTQITTKDSKVFLPVNLGEYNENCGNRDVIEGLSHDGSGERECHILAVLKGALARARGS